MLKKLSIFILAVSAILGITAAATPSYEIVDYGTGEIRIFGECGTALTSSFASIDVIKPGVEASSIPKNLSGTDWQNYFAFKGQFAITGDEYEQYMILPPLKEATPYMANINVNNQRCSIPVYYYAEQSISDFIAELNQLTIDSDDASLSNATESAMNYFSLNTSDIYQKMYNSLEDKAEITRILLKNCNGTPLAKDEGDAPYASIIREYERAMVIAAYNSGLLDKLIGDDGEILYSELIKKEGNEDDTFEYVYNMIKNDVTEEGRKNIVNTLCNNSFESAQDFIDKFENEAVYTIVTYATQYGAGVITNALKDKKLTEILEAQGWDKELYNDSSKTNVANMLYSNPAKDSADLIDKLNQYAEKYPAGSTAVSGGSSGSGGGKKNSSPSTGVMPGVAVAPSTEKKQVFADVPSGHWAEKSIMALYEKNVISGVGDDLFKPLDYVTREQFVKMLVTALDYSLSENESSFADVGTGQWYYPYVVTAVENGIVNGISETEFGTGALITREQIATMCYRTVKITDIDALATEEFKDQADVSEYALESVIAMRKLGIIKGNENGEFLPGNYATRAEAAQIIFGIINLM